MSSTQSPGSPDTKAKPSGAGGAGDSARQGSADRTPDKSAIKRTTDGVKRLILVLLGALAALFAVFNSRSVEVRWIFGEPIQSPLILVIAICLGAGFLGGWIVGHRGGSSS